MASEELHCVLVPLMAQGHIIPLTDFGLQLAHRGLTVTIITTPLNAIRYQPTIDHATTSSHLKIKLMSIPFPSEEAGLRQGCENQDSLTSKDVGFTRAIELMKEPVETLIGELMPRPSCIVSTNSLSWTAEIAFNFRIPCYRFFTISCFTVVCLNMIVSSKIRDKLISDTESFFVPGIPHRIEFNWSQVKSCLPQSHDKKDKQVYPLRGYLVNSFEEMETSYFDTYKPKCKFWGIGPVSLCNKEISDKVNRGNKPSIDEYSCIKWLDSMKPSSVIYACFGSQSCMTWTQLSQVGYGLQTSNKPFIWVVRKNEQLVLLETWLEKLKFEETVKGRGLIIRGWAPQVLILSHPSIGGFLTHCGWNSTLEGVCAGVPMITWPLGSEQFYNEKFVVNVHRIGVRIGVESPYIHVDSPRVEEAIRELMDGEEAEERRKRARALGEMAKKAVAEGGSSHSNITVFIQDLLQHVTNTNQAKPISSQAKVISSEDKARPPTRKLQVYQRRPKNPLGTCKKQCSQHRELQVYQRRPKNLVGTCKKQCSQHSELQVYQRHPKNLVGMSKKQCSQHCELQVHQRRPKNLVGMSKKKECSPPRELQGCQRRP